MTLENGTTLVALDPLGCAEGERVLVTQGSVAVKAATEAGAEAANQIGEVAAVHVIPRPHGDLGKHFTAVAQK